MKKLGILIVMVMVLTSLTATQTFFSESDVPVKKGKIALSPHQSQAESDQVEEDDVIIIDEDEEDEETS